MAIVKQARTKNGVIVFQVGIVQGVPKYSSKSFKVKETATDLAVYTTCFELSSLSENEVKGIELTERNELVNE